MPESPYPAPQRTEPETKTAEERIIVGALEAFVKGIDQNQVDQTLRIREDGSVGAWVGLRDENQILWIRLYETLEPQDGVVVGVAPVAVFTATAMRARLHIDVVNNQAATQATIRLRRNYDGSSTETNLCTPDTPIPVGVGFRIGTFDLAPSGYIEAESNTANGAVVYVTVDAYDPVGP